MTPRPRRWLAVGTIAAGLAAVLTPATASATTPSSQYYVSLGDSLSIGIQPGPDGHNRPTDLDPRMTDHAVVCAKGLHLL